MIFPHKDYNAESVSYCEFAKPRRSKQKTKPRHHGSPEKENETPKRKTPSPQVTRTKKTKTHAKRCDFHFLLQKSFQT